MIKTKKKTQCWGFFLDYQTHEQIDQNLPNQYNLHILKQTPLKYSKIELNLTRVFTYSPPKPTKRTPNMQLFSLLKKPNILQLQRWMFQWSNTITTSKFALFIYFYFFFKDLVFASEFFELSAKSGELFLHHIGSNLRYIFTHQPILILHKYFSTHKSKIKKKPKIKYKKEGKWKQTLAAAAVCKPPIPGLLLIFVLLCTISSWD